MPALILGPVGCITAMIIYIRRHRLAICNECRLHNGTALERGRAGAIFAHESELQMKNMIFIFGLIGVLAWIYYYKAFSEISYSDRDSFVFKWTTTIILLTDIVYFGIRYYNLYLDLKESGELVTPAEIKHQPANTRVRFYVICDDSIYLARESNAERTDEGLGQVYDTPFRSSRPGKDIDEGTVKQMAAKETDITNGYLKFFFSRRMSPGSENRVNRYFYFLPGEISDYPELAKKGEWLSSEKFKTIFNTRPLTLSPLFLSDMNRLATIMVTSKTFNESGERRTKLMQYRPSFSFAELPGSKVDFHGETWMRVSIYNSDRRWFRLNRWINKHFRSRSQSQDYYHDSI